MGSKNSGFGVMWGIVDGSTELVQGGSVDVCVCVCRECRVCAESALVYGPVCKCTENVCRGDRGGSAEIWRAGVQRCAGRVCTSIRGACVEVCGEVVCRGARQGSAETHRSACRDVRTETAELCRECRGAQCRLPGCGGRVCMRARAGGSLWKINWLMRCCCGCYA